MPYKSIKQRYKELHDNQINYIARVLPPKRKLKRRVPKKQKRIMLLDTYCRNQNGKCVSCGNEMIKPVLRQNNNGFYTGACCDRLECREVEVNQNKEGWFKND